MRGTETEVCAEAEGDVRIGLAIQADLLGLVKDRFIKVRRSEAKRNALAGFDLDAVGFGGAGGGASDVGDRRKGAQQFLAGEGDELRVGAQSLKSIGLFGKVRNRTCD